jgi:hypothetical protein
MTDMIPHYWRRRKRDSDVSGDCQRPYGIAFSNSRASAAAHSRLLLGANHDP